MAYLVLNTPTSEPQRIKLTGDNVLVGRAIGCDLWIDDIKLSRQHCRIEHDGEEWLLIDLNSTNGTLVNGQWINEVVLHEGDLFEAGRATIEFHEGEFIEHRPADPIEAALMGPGLL